MSLVYLALKRPALGCFRQIYDCKVNSGISRAFMQKWLFNPIRGKMRWFYFAKGGAIYFTKLKDLHNSAHITQKCTLLSPNQPWKCINEQKKTHSNFVSKLLCRVGASGRTRTYNPSVNSSLWEPKIEGSSIVQQPAVSEHPEADLWQGKWRDFCHNALHFPLEKPSFCFPLHLFSFE